MIREFNKSDLGKLYKPAQNSSGEQNGPCTKLVVREVYVLASRCRLYGAIPFCTL